MARKNMYCFGIFVVTEVIEMADYKDTLNYYRDKADEAIDRIVFLYNDWREKIKLPSGKTPPRLSKRQIARLTRELAVNKKATLKSPKSWGHKFTWTVEKSVK